MSSWGTPNQHWNTNASDGQATFGQPEERKWGQMPASGSTDKQDTQWGSNRSGGWSQGTNQEANQERSWGNNRGRDRGSRGNRGGYQANNWQDQSYSSPQQEQDWGQNRDFGDRRGRGRRGGPRRPRNDYQENYDRPQNSYGGYNQRDQYNDQYERQDQNYQSYNQRSNQGYRDYNSTSYVNYRDRFPTISEDQFNLIKKGLGRFADQLLEDRLKIQLVMDEAEAATMAKYNISTFQDKKTEAPSYFTPNLGPRPPPREESYGYTGPSDYNETSGYNEAPAQHFQEPPQQYNSTPQPVNAYNSPPQPMSTQAPQPMNTQAPSQSSSTSGDFANQYRNLVTQHQKVQEQNRKLEDELQALKATFNCDFCTETPKEMILSCGHGFCSMCCSEPCLVCRCPNSGRPITIKY